MANVTRVDGSGAFTLADVDPAEGGGGTGENGETAERRLGDLTRELLELQGLVQAAERHGVLIVLQGMDAAGKDVTIQQALGLANPEAIRVKHFSTMTEEEALHDFTWRAHLAAPKRGEWVVFDRSYYEQLILPQVQDETSSDDDGEPAGVEERFGDVVAFESILRHGGTILIKIFLHVSAEEQERRLVERMEDDETAWKISAKDWVAHRNWDRYMAAWERTIQATATPEAPWMVVPADDEAARDLAVAELLVERLRPYRDEWTRERTRIGREKREEALQEAPERIRRSA